jgi:4-hydroxythreonine-4-phosphate dehydrogenase
VYDPSVTRSDTRKPVLAVSLGDPAGIGPEIVAKAQADPRVIAACTLRLFGRTTYTPLSDTFTAADAGAISHRAVLDAIDAVKAGQADALVTAPISKDHWHRAGHTAHPGHTELLAEAFASPDSGMLFIGPTLRVVLATIHIPLAHVTRVLTPALVASRIRLGHQACVELGIATQRIAVAGINPHAGEGGMFGDEELRLLHPAIDTCRREGLTVIGPVPGDAVFNHAADGDYDLVVAMYHDQGLIPVKLIDRRRTVNTTAGLRWQGRRITRTSPAHGTAFDIASRNQADPTSMIEAILLAAKMCGYPGPPGRADRR